MMGKREQEWTQAAARTEDTYHNPYELGTRGYWAVQDILFDRFMSFKPARLAELHDLAARDGVTLDGTPGSLAMLDDWLYRIRQEPFEDGADWDIIWARRDPDRPMGRGWRTHVADRVTERVAWYYGDVVMDVLPGSRWGWWRDRRYNLIATGHFLLDIGTFDRKVNPLLMGGAVLGSVYATLRDPADPDYSPHRQYTFVKCLADAVKWREDFLAEHGELDFQRAPTGEAAGINRGPYKGKVRTRIDRALGNT
jgi:hypothetical protein